MINTVLSEMCHSIFVQRVIQSPKSFMDYAELFSCLTIHFQTRGIDSFQIVPFVYEKLQGEADI